MRASIAHKLAKYVPFKLFGSTWVDDSSGNLDDALKILHKWAAVFPPLQATLQELILCVGAMNPSPKHRVEYKELTASLAILSTALSQHLQESKSASMSEFIERMSM
ncbi:hypothetical protein BN14_08782 [Rhizoctonia solani AG-1 IB]|uniref:Uncharacterized protein n=1 Tax=Thanatephorus cucumeris (strain AG1-IB / isolate 7/3/14) TaxID=1108050 RepID=M5CFC9_THACB|nr:hypothetical protein BN14_08782 [Rhizoctonia solani AG-1 IB]